MLFTSLEFIFFFFPVFFIVYFILPIKMKNYWILLSSLFFYAWGDPSFVILLVLSIAINYILALRMEEFPKGQFGRKCIFLITLVINIGSLIVFKYLNFITGTIHTIFHTPESTITKIALPLGISFFVFQSLSYIIDVYRETVPAQKNICHLGIYIAMFPRITAGPIVRYSTVMDQFENRKVTFSSFSEGMIRFMIGFCKKMLLANTLMEVADQAFSLKEISVLMAWLGALSYSLQIFFDFCGYSDMAIGLGTMLGFRFPENFDYPYISKSITEFWRRWHMTLGGWFRDYVYFPLGGSRVNKKIRLVFNLMVVWLLTGIWHGANWTFILWGVLYGVVLIIEKLCGIPKKYEKWTQIARLGYRVLTLLLVMFGWVLFRSSSIDFAWKYIQSMFGLNGNSLVGDNFVFYSREFIVYFIVGIVASTPLCKLITSKIIKTTTKDIVCFIGYIGVLVLFIVSITMLVMSAHNPFIYNQF